MIRLLCLLGFFSLFSGSPGKDASTGANTGTDEFQASATIASTGNRAKPSHTASDAD